MCRSPEDASFMATALLINSVDGNKPTPRQSETLAAMERAGATHAYAVGLDAALGQLEAWGLLRGRAV